jgi:hypothetical protein
MRKLARGLECGGGGACQLKLDKILQDKEEKKNPPDNNPNFWSLARLFSSSDKQGEWGGGLLRTAFLVFILTFLQRKRDSPTTIIIRMN